MANIITLDKKGENTMEWNLNRTIKDTFESLKHSDYQKIDYYVCMNSDFHNIDELVDNYTLCPHKQKMKVIDKLLSIQNKEINGTIKFSEFLKLADKMINNEELL